MTSHANSRTARLDGLTSNQIILYEVEKTMISGYSITL
jgi:hypothetical protein